ncbi:MAG: hypothetical protein Sapg2KO_48840 [Saprospiraceae bacterium]
MRVKSLLLLFFLFISSISYGQNREKYAALVQEASSLYHGKDFEKSAQKYKAAFDALEGKAYPSDRYNAACSYALANDSENAFYHLFRLAESGSKYRDYNHITSDSDLNALHSNKRWNELVALVKTNKEEYEKDLDKPLVKQLDAIYQLDQSYRRQIGDIEEKYGRNSEEMQNHWRLIMETDSINLIKVKKILDERGWLGPKVLGQQGNGTLFLVIQHSDLETQVKYLPMMREAVKKGNARASSLALLEDRVALGQGKRQIYGSQIGRDPESGEYYVLPLLEPENVNARRREVGLGPIEEYTFQMNLTWNLEKHKERTKRIESVQKK